MDKFIIDSGVSNLKNFEFKTPMYNYFEDNLSISEYIFNSCLSKSCVIVPFSKGNFGNRIYNNEDALFHPVSSEEYIIASMSMNTRLASVKKKLNAINSLEFNSETQCLVFLNAKLTTYITPTMYANRIKKNFQL